MAQGPSIARIGALIGNPARANILIALLDGRALTAGELAFAAGLTPQTTSGHLADLTQAGLLARARQGRHVYHRLARADVAAMIEAVMAVAADGDRVAGPRWRGGEALREARTCYDHLAGRLGVAVADGLIAGRRIELDPEGGRMTTVGTAFFEGFGIELAKLRRGRRVWCRPCLDWSERRPHLAGGLGAALAARCFDLAWIERRRDTRALTVTPAGRSGFREMFGVDSA